jgi:hypothetical protein
LIAELRDSLLYKQIEIKNVIDEISLENDFVPAMYSSAKVSAGTEDLESITTSPGEVSTIMQLVSESGYYRKTYGSLYGWYPDSGDKADANNKGFIARKEYYNGKTIITIFYPLRHLFGLFDYYEKMYYGINNITLTLNMLEEDKLSKRIFFGSKLKDEATGVTGKLPKIKIKKLQWWIPIYTLNLTAAALFHEQLNKDKNVGIGFMKRRMAKTSFNVSDYTWTIAEVSKHIRYVFIVFKTEKPDAKNNNNLFTAKNIRKLQVSVNGEEYSEMNLNTDTGDVGEPYLAKIEACSYFGVECQLNIKEFIELYPVFCFNTTPQNEALQGNSLSILIEKNGTDQMTAYALMLEEEHINANLADNSIRKL